MCLVVFALGQDPSTPLIVAGNRDEFHARPAAAAGWWDEPPGILGGRDLEAGGTWLALHRRGRFATVTNYRDAAPAEPGRPSRGLLVTGFLESMLDPLAYLETIDGTAYAGFNLFVSDGRRLAYCSNRGARATELEPGFYAIGNADLDAPLSKVKRSRDRLRALVAAGKTDDESLFALLADREPGPAAEAEADADRLPLPAARAITAPFIVLPDYGTRCSTVVRAHADGNWSLAERRFAPDGSRSGDVAYSVRPP